MSSFTDHELDLPLMSNNSEINVYHYILDLFCNFEEKQFIGHITIFCKSGNVTESFGSNRSSFGCEKATQSRNTCCEPILCSQNHAESDINQKIDSRGEVTVKQEKCFMNQSEDPCSLQSKNQNNSRRCSDEACTVVTWKRQKILSLAKDAKNQSESNFGSMNTRTGELETECKSNHLESFCKINKQNLDNVSVDCSAVKQTVIKSGNFEEINNVPSTLSLMDDSKLHPYSICEIMAVTNEPNSNYINKQENSSEKMLHMIIGNAKQSNLLREQDTLNENYYSLSSSSSGTKNETETNRFGKSESVTQTDSLISDSEGECRCPRLPGTVVSDTEALSDDFIMILDCWDIHAEKVEEIPVSNEFKNIAEHEMTCNETYEKLLLCSKFEGNSLCFQSDKRCLKIYKKGVKSAEDFPRVIRISYRTHPKGFSLKWTKDQDGRDCVFTHGHWINNRSLFPSQDVPVAMATWQATIHVPQETVALMSGDEEPTINTEEKDWLSCYYYTKLEMPSSTVSLAVGSWRQAEIVVRKDRNAGSSTACPDSSDYILPCRLFSPSCLLEQAKGLIDGYMPRCMEVASQMLGPHPFKRLDILVVPSSFCSLGMASPSLMFISQSILSSDREMCIRLAHELSHSWFGLIIGPKDWTEEWLSEGFCTYTEGYFHGIVMQWDDVEKQEQIEIRDYLKFKTLEAESLSTQKELQTLRPNKGELDYADGELKFVRNGMNPDKGFMQVHYLKGYFLLQYLETSVGTEYFYQFLRSFVHEFSGKLVLSQHAQQLLVVNSYRKEFARQEQIIPLRIDPMSKSHLIQRNKQDYIKEDQGITEDKVYEDWLDNPGLHMFKALSRSTNSLASTSMEQAEEISAFNRKYCSLHWTKKRKLKMSKCFRLKQLKAIQVLLVLDILLVEDKIHTDVLEYIQVNYQLHIANADIQHKWCELAIKNKSQQHYMSVKAFLINHQAMGVYLFGELILSRDKEQRKIAEDTFRLIADDMEEGVYKTVHLMVYGT